MFKIGVCALSIILTLGLSGCGQTGPLYLPKDEPVKTIPAPESTPEPTTGTATPSQ